MEGHSYERSLRTMWNVQGEANCGGRFQFPSSYEMRIPIQGDPMGLSQLQCTSNWSRGDIARVIHSGYSNLGVSHAQTLDYHIGVSVESVPYMSNITLGLLRPSHGLLRKTVG